MHLSIITDEVSENFEHALQVCRELDIDTVELRVVDGQNIVFHEQASLRRIRDLLQAGGFQVCSIASPFLKCPHWAADSASASVEQAREWESLQRSFEIAHLLGAPHVRTFSFLRVPNPVAARPVVLETIAEAVRRTEQAGLKLVLENEHACNLATGEEAAWLLNQIENSAFGLTWDPGNEAVLGFNAFPEGYQHVRGPRILHMHIKDANRHLESARKEERFVKIGTGCIDYVAQFRALAADGYDGMLSLETHYKHPQGGREQATRESLAALRTILQEAEITLN